jgi:hypothetical protein
MKVHKEGETNIEMKKQLFGIQNRCIHLLGKKGIANLISLGQDSCQGT